MKELDPMVFLAVFQEIFGLFFWPLVAFVVLGLLAFLAILMRERSIDPRRLVWSELVGLGGGFVGIWFMMAITSSRIEDLGGPIDWLLATGIWAAGAVEATIAAYIVLYLLGFGHRTMAPLMR
ncbi:MAG: DUF5368 domain-containing protein [Pseudomonadota bacterium]